MKKFATHRAVSKSTLEILRYLQVANVTLQQYTDGQVTKSCKEADVYNESASNDVFIEGVEASIFHSHRCYWP